MNVSVVLPVHNRAWCIRRAIDSVLAQTHRDLELIVIDDASTDATPTAVREVTDPRLRYLRLDRNLGPGGARNYGVAAASAEWVAFQDSDDRWLPDKLERQLAAAHGQDDVALVVTTFSATNGYPVALHAPIADGSIHDATQRAALWLPGCSTWLARREALQRAGGFKTDVWCYEDWELALRLIEAGQRILLVNEALVVCDKTPNSLFAREPERVGNLRRVVEDHRQLLSAHPEAWAYYANALGQNEARYGSMSVARSWFMAALRARPFAPRAWANLAASLTGQRVFEHYLRAGRRVMALASVLRHGKR